MCNERYQLCLHLGRYNLAFQHINGVHAKEMQNCNTRFSGKQFTVDKFWPGYESAKHLLAIDWYIDPSLQQWYSEIDRK